MFYSPPCIAFIADTIGGGEILVVLTVALLVFGSKRLPEMARTLGRTVERLRRASDEFREQLTAAADVPEEEPPAAAPPRDQAGTSRAPAPEGRNDDSGASLPIHEENEHAHDRP